MTTTIESPFRTAEEERFHHSLTLLALLEICDAGTLTKVVQLSLDPAFVAKVRQSDVHRLAKLKGTMN